MLNKFLKFIKKDCSNLLLIIGIIFFIFFSILTFILYARNIGGMSFFDIFHFWDYISDQSNAWDTFSFLISGVLSSSFGGITLLFLIVQHFKNIKDKNYEEKKKNEEKEKIENEKIILEKDRLTIRYIDDMRYLNKELVRVYNNSSFPTAAEIFKNMNTSIERNLHIWLLLSDIEENVQNWENYKEFKKLFPIRQGITEPTIDWESFKNIRDNNHLAKLINTQNLSNDILVEILCNTGDKFPKEKLKEINEEVISKVVLNSFNKIYNSLYQSIIEHFIYAMNSLKGYQEGINYYFLQLPEEQRYFFLFISKDEVMIKSIKTAIRNSNLNDIYSKHKILTHFGKYDPKE